MTKSLARACLDRAKHARRPDMRTYAETERRRRLVADHRARVGDWCPGLEDHPAHPSADLVADHVIEVAVAGWRRGRCWCCAAPRTAAGAPKF
jgi:hypothetical protein